MVIGDRNAGFYRRREGLDQILADGNAATTGVDIVESPSLMSLAVLYPTSPQDAADLVALVSACLGRVGGGVPRGSVCGFRT